MARPLLHEHPLTSASQLCLAIGSVFFFAFTLFMCAGHSKKWVRQLKACYSYSYEETVIHIDNAGMNHGFQYENEEEEEDPVWQKNILMGGKCQLPDFSGVIIYDSAGNIVPPTKPKLLALTWK